MTLRELDRTEDRNFERGETIYDVDGNAYTVLEGFAYLQVSTTGLRYELTGETLFCFSRINPRAQAAA